MALWPNGNVSTLTRTRFLAGAGPLRTSVHGNNGGERYNRFVSAYWSKVLGAAPGSGHYAGSAWILPITGGAIASSTGNRLTVTVGTGTAQDGRFIDGSTAVTLTVADAALQLLVLAEGTATLTLTVNNASLGAAVGIEGSTSAALTVDPSTLGALAGMFASPPTCTITPSGVLTATGALAGNILPYTELSPENLANAVIAAAQESPIWANVQQINDNEVIGTGTTGDSWRGVGVSP